MGTYVVDSDEKVIWLYLCPKLRSTVSITSCNKYYAGLSVSDGVVFLTMQSKKYTNPIVLSLAKKTEHPFSCKDLENCLTLRRDIGRYTDPICMNKYQTINVKNPGHCQWTKTVVRVEDEFLFSVYPFAERDITEYPCDDYGTNTDKLVESNNPCVPGLQIKATHYFGPPEQISAVECGKLWYHTCSLTGGKIVKINNEYDTVDITYDVFAEGWVLKNVRPSDFVDYKINDYVFIMPKTDECQINCNDALGIGLLGEAPDPEISEEDEEVLIYPEKDGAGYIIIPVKIGDFGA